MLHKLIPNFRYASKIEPNYDYLLTMLWATHSKIQPKYCVISFQHVDVDPYACIEKDANQFVNRGVQILVFRMRKWIEQLDR